MKGYWNNEQKTKEVIDDEHWMHTGDLAVIDDEGYCSIVGRIKVTCHSGTFTHSLRFVQDCIIRGGENIFPREIEEFLYSHPDIGTTCTAVLSGMLTWMTEDIQVIGVPDAKYGEQVCAWIKVKEGHTLTEQQVKDYCNEKIAHYKVQSATNGAC
jgi:fatty-acyl-CoA synthase